MDALKSKAIPHNIEAEKCVLGAMTLTLDAVMTAIHHLKPQDFYKQEHQDIFEAIVALSDKGIVADLVALLEFLEKKGKLQTAGGPAYVTSIVHYVPTTANLEGHSEIIKEKALLRRLIETSTEIVENCFNPEMEIKELIDTAEKKIFEVSNQRVKSDFTPIRDLVKHSIEKAEELYNLKDSLTGVGTGFAKLDQFTCGLQPSDMIVLAARPSMGKTAFALNIVEHIAVVEKKSVGVFSLEMSKEQIVFRLLCSHARVSSQKIRSGFLKKEDFPRLENAYSRLREAPIYIDDTPGITVMEMRGKARRLKAQTNCQFLIIDYLQLMSSGFKRNDGRQQEISDISRSIKELARELNIPVMILSQLNRSVEQRADHRPMLSDLRESGAIEQDADVVLMLTRKEYYNKEDEPGIADLILAKQRNGPTGDIKLHFNNEYTRFENLSFGDEMDEYISLNQE